MVTMDNCNDDDILLNVSSDEGRQDVSESSLSNHSLEEDTIDALMRDYEKLGSTPPRTRILRRDRSKEKIKNKHRHRKTVGHDKLPCKVIGNTKKYINAHFNFFNQLDDEGSGESNPRKRHNKRLMQRIRGTERDFKLDIDNEIHFAKEGKNTMPTIKIESSNRFLSLSCKLVKTAIQWRGTSLPEAGRNRIEFHQSFSTMIKSGNTEDKNCRRQLSREEHLWQTELKDLIWLELQAWKADKTPTQQDKYLCEARQSIPQLLVDILNYRFVKKLDHSSAGSSDSGIQISLSEPEDICSGCFSMFCSTCIEHENNALREVEMLMQRLENAEALYPSSKAFGNQYPLYKSDEITGRVKAMCLWYNIMRHHRLKLLILGKQLLSYAEGNVADSSTSKSGSPEFRFSNEWDFYNIQPLRSLGRYFHHLDCGDTRTYRKFIEDVLKLRGLRKALHFLEHLHLKVLRKGRIAMEKPNSVDKPEDKAETDEERELRRYGYWSNEFQSLGLPSFRPAFLFISRIPLDVIHEFLRMRLETKVEKPSALSIRQLIKELKEGLKLSVLNKQRYLQHCETALCDTDAETKAMFENYVTSFDESVQSVLKLYLSYIEQWVTLTQHERLQKNILEEEWKFVIYTTPHIPGGESLAGSVFCNIACSMLITISGELSDSVAELEKNFCSSEEEISSNTQSSRQSVLHLCRELQSLYIYTRERTLRVLSLTKTLAKYLESDIFNSCKTIEDALNLLKDSVLNMCENLTHIVQSMEKVLLFQYLDESSDVAIQSRCREVLHTIYKFTFEYYKEVGKFTTDKNQLTQGAICFAKQWIYFATNHCEKGRGVRPRWASYGLEFLVHVTDPKFTNNLTDKEFEDFKKCIESCVSHIMGTPSNSSSYNYMANRSSSPSPTLVPGRLSFSSISEISGAVMDRSQSQPSLSDSSTTSRRKHSRIIEAITKLEEEYDNKLRSEDLIGTVVAVPSFSSEKNSIRPRSVNFSWQRGIKIGQGRFGKVYTAVNTESGELMAMKEISLQPNDMRTVRDVAVEFKIFEGIQHDHLVRYYGAEIHREELLIFMQLCTEGTLESLVAATETGLPEGLVRRYTAQLVSALTVLHENSIVHRDIKPANIFLTAEGNCLKLGDFGSAVKIRSHTTVPGELRGFVGTQAYMAPEVFMKSNTSGHGRAADIWSLGCVVIEMASGKRPWHEYDSNYQIMFKVGMGETPKMPPHISEEGKNFISKCIQHNPKRRTSTFHLKQHTFLKVDSEEECFPFTTPSMLEDYLKLGIKR